MPPMPPLAKVPPLPAAEPDAPPPEVPAVLEVPAEALEPAVPPLWPAVPPALLELVHALSAIDNVMMNQRLPNVSAMNDTLSSVFGSTFAPLCMERARDHAHRERAHDHAFMYRLGCGFRERDAAA